MALEASDKETRSRELFDCKLKTKVWYANGPKMLYRSNGLQRVEGGGQIWQLLSTWTGSAPVNRRSSVDCPDLLSGHVQNPFGAEGFWAPAAAVAGGLVRNRSRSSWTCGSCERNSVFARLYVHASAYLEWGFSMCSAIAQLLGELQIICDVIKVYVEMN